MERYSEYKDSGVKWLGEIPSHWNPIPLKKCFLYTEAGIWGNDPSNDEYDSICIRVADFDYAAGVTKLNGLTFRSYGSELTESKKLRQGDLLLEKSGGGDIYPVGRVVRYRHTNMSTTCSNFIQKLCPSLDYSSDFLYFLFKSMYLKRVNGLYYNQTTGIQNLKVKEYLNQIVYIPIFEEQIAIASYLDSVTSKIDRAIAQQQRMIELLNERKQIIINNAVTKGLDPNVPMKDSGVEWIGMIPEHWEVIRIKYLLNESKVRSETGNEEPLSMSQVYGLIPTKNMDTIPNIASSFVGAKMVKRGDLVFNKLKAHLGVFNVSKYDGLVSPDYAVYSSTGRACLPFLEYIFKTPKCIHEFVKLITGVGAGLSRLYTSDLYSIYCALPSIEEQTTICDYIENNTTKIKEAIAMCHHQISLLQERKQIIINDVVTGKVKVV